MKMPMLSLRHILAALVALLLSLPLSAQGERGGRMWMFGATRANIYDEYLSPLDYKGYGGTMTMISERAARWSPKVVIDTCDFVIQSKVTSFLLLDLTGSYTVNPSGNAHFYEVQTQFAAGWHANWFFHPGIGQRVRVRAGGLAEFSAGGTYSTRNGNNPGQGRAAIDLAASTIADIYFRSPFKRQHEEWILRAELDIPFLGAMFSPQYGQSYYEIFSLRHYDRNVCMTWPVNAPSARLVTTFDIPIGDARILLGYRGEARQSHVHHLGRHAWTNGLVVGFVHRF